jgi:uncharacterized membrane protein YkvA (DUF1232 family)
MARRRIDPNRVSDPGLLASMLEHLHLCWRLLNDRRVPGTLKTLVPALGVLYLLSPIDLVPDVILGLGQLDDVGMLMLLLNLFVRLAPERVVAEHRAALRDEPPVTAEDGRGAPIDADFEVGGRR